MNTWDLWDQIKGKMPWLEGAETGLLGKKTTTLPGQATERSGGMFGYGGAWDQGTDMAKQGLEWAGGKAGEAVDAGKDYFMGEKVWTPDAPTKLSRTGVHSSKSMEHLETSLKKADKFIDKAVDKGEEWFEGASAAMFPGQDDVNVTDNEKATLKEMMDSGKVDHGFVNYLKNKNSSANQNDLNTLEKFIGVSKEDAMKTWKDKGGFEGLMSNPAFTLGLALMQSSAEGKNISQGILDNFITAAGISEHYKDRIKAKGSIVGPPSDAEIGQVEALLKSKKIGAPGWGQAVKDFFTGANSEAEYKSMLSKIASKNKQRASALEAKGKKVEMNEDFMMETIRIMKQNGELKWKKKGHTKGFLSGWNFFQPRLGTTNNDMFKAKGGPIKAGKPYVVGEEGPEIIIPKQDGQVLSNDDSQIFAMLLEANPQLKNISRKRAEAILKSRFPDYFV